MLNELYFLTLLLCVVSELAFDKGTNKKLFTGQIEFERFYRYLRYASLNTFMHRTSMSTSQIMQMFNIMEIQG